MAKKPTKSRNISVYSNLTRGRKTKKDAAARKKAEYLASLPKHPVKRLLYRLHPKRVAGYWFSKKGGFMALKILGACVLLGILSVGALFAYYRKDLDTIRPGEFGLETSSSEVLKVWDATQAKDMLLSVLDGLPGPACDIVLLNAGAAIYVADRAATLGEGIEVAREVIRSGAAREKLRQLVAFSQRTTGA